jgi:hypothetical protein
MIISRFIQDIQALRPIDSSISLSTNSKLFYDNHRYIFNKSNDGKDKRWKVDSYLHSLCHPNTTLLLLFGSKTQTGETVPCSHYQISCLPLSIRHHLQVLHAPRFFNACTHFLPHLQVDQQSGKRIIIP